MKPLIITYSFSGRTAKTAKIILEALSEHDPVHSSIRIKGKFMERFEMMDALEKGNYSSIEDELKVIQETDFDTLIIGMPTWGNYPPKVFDAILSKLPDLSGKRVFVFTTAIFTGGNTVNYMKEKVIEKGASPVQGRKFRAAFWIRKSNVLKFASEMK